MTTKERKRIMDIAAAIDVDSGKIIALASHKDAVRQALRLKARSLKRKADRLERVIK